MKNEAKKIILSAAAALLTFLLAGCSDLIKPNSSSLTVSFSKNNGRSAIISPADRGVDHYSVELKKDGKLLTIVKALPDSTTTFQELDPGTYSILVDGWLTEEEVFDSEYYHAFTTDEKKSDKSVTLAAGDNKEYKIVLKEYKADSEPGTDPDPAVTSIAVTYDGSPLDITSLDLNSISFKISENGSAATNLDTTKYTVTCPENSIGMVPFTVTSKSDASVSAVCVVQVNYSWNDAIQLLYTDEAGNVLTTQPTAITKIAGEACALYIKSSLNPTYDIYTLTEGSSTPVKTKSNIPVLTTTYKWYEDNSYSSFATGNTAEVTTSGSYYCYATIEPAESSSAYATSTTKRYSTSSYCTVTFKTASIASTFAELATIISNIASGSSATIIIEGDNPASALPEGTITVNGDVTIIAKTNTTYKRPATFTSNSLLKVNYGASLTLKGYDDSTKLILDGGYSSSDSSPLKASKPLIESYGQLTLGQNVTLQNNYNTTAGGAVYASVITADISDTTTATKFVLDGALIQECISEKNGGGVHIAGVADTTNTTLKQVNVEINSGLICGNKSSINGGGIYCTGVSAEMTGGEISLNECGGGSNNGAGIYISSIFNVSGKDPLTNSVFTMNGGKIIENSNAQYGGGVYLNAGTFNWNTNVASVSQKAIISNNSTTNSIGTVIGTSASNCVYNKNSVQKNSSNTAYFE